MKKFRRVLALVLTVMLLIPAAVSAFQVSAASNYVLELGLNNIKNDYYEFMAYDLANKQLLPLETEARATWSPDWPGHFVVGHDLYVIGKPERNGIVDMMPRTTDNLAPAIVFTAPNAGKFNVIAEFDKLYGEQASGTSFVDIMLIKVSTGEVIMTEEKVAHGEVKWVKKNVELAEGEKVCIITVVNAESTRTIGGHNLALISLLVNETVEQSTTPIPTKPAETTPDPDDTTVPENIDNGSSEKIDPVVIIACVGGALVVVAVVIVIVVAAKKKSKK